MRRSQNLIVIISPLYASMEKDQWLYQLKHAKIFCFNFLLAISVIKSTCWHQNCFLIIVAAQQSRSFDPGNSALALNKHTTGSLSSYDYQSKLGVIPQIDVENNTSSLTQPQPNILDPGSPGLPPRIRYSNAPTKASATPSSWLNNSIEPPVRCSDNEYGYSVSIPVKLRQDVSRKEEIGTFTTEHDNVIKSNANPDISTCETIPDHQQVHNDRDDEAISDDEKVELYFSPSPPALCGNHYQNALGTAFTSTAQEASPKKHSAPLPAPRRGNTPPSNNSGQNHYQNHDFSWLSHSSTFAIHTFQTLAFVFLMVSKEIPSKRR